MPMTHITAILQNWIDEQCAILAADLSRETCWHCHTTEKQTGEKRGWDRCDSCGVMLSLDPKIPGILEERANG